MQWRRAVVAVALAALLVLAGCSGAGGGDGGAEPGGGTGDGAPAETRGQGDTGGKGSGDSELDVRDRALVRTGTVDLRVKSFGAARETVVAAARERGGFVSDTRQRVHTEDNRSWTTGELVLRVPAENFSGLLAAVRDAGEVRRVVTGTEDVSDRLVDIEARLANLRAQRARLRELYNATNDTDALLDIQERLSAVQSRIERLAADRERLRRKVAYATLTVSIGEREPGPDAPADPRAWYETSLPTAFATSLAGVVWVLRTLGVAGAYLLPPAALVGVPAAGVYLVARRRLE